jgi:hypothetical protein
MKGGPSKSAGTFFDLPVHRRSGDTLTLRGPLHVLRDEAGQPIGAMAILTAARP